MHAYWAPQCISLISRRWIFYLEKKRCKITREISHSRINDSLYDSKKKKENFFSWKKFKWKAFQEYFLFQNLFYFFPFILKKILKKEFDKIYNRIISRILEFYNNWKITRILTIYHSRIETLQNIFTFLCRSPIPDNPGQRN